MAGGGFNSRGPIAARSSRRRSVMVLSQREALATHARRSASIRLTTLPVSRGFTAVRIGSRLRFLVHQRAECVFVAVFKFARFDRLHGRDARSKPKFSVAVAAVAVAAVAVAAVAAAIVAAAVVAVIVTVIGRIAVCPVSGAGA